MTRLIVLLLAAKIWAVVIASAETSVKTSIESNSQNFGLEICVWKISI